MDPIELRKLLICLIIFEGAIGILVIVIGMRLEMYMKEILRKYK